MARERWFYAEGHRRMGPVARRELVEALLQLTDPRACLIWRHGLQAWAPAADLPEIDRLLASFAHVEPRSPAPAAGPARPAVDALTPGAPRRVSAPSARPEAGGRRHRGTPLYVGGAAVALLVIGALAWLRWLRPGPEVPSNAARSAPPVTAGGSSPLPGPEAISTPEPATGGGQGFAGWADQEADLPQAELRRLRGVGGWAGDKLTVTLYNGSSWRVTEIFVRTSWIEGDRFVDAVAPQRLLPPGGAPVDAAVGELLKKVAPDRKRAGVNPADTGPFEAVVGPQPPAYRWKIESARGYPPRLGP